MVKFEDIIKECSYKTARSGGAGGQHVNKVETKVEIIWHVETSAHLSQKQKGTILKAYPKLIDSDGYLHCQSQESRSQVKNKEKAQQKLVDLIKLALKPKKKRKKTRPPKSAKEKRIKVKRIKSETKQNRKKVQW